MIQLPLYQGKKVGVLGLGKAGLAAAKALRASGAEVCAWDDGKKGQLAAKEAGILLTPYEGWDWPVLAAMVMSPGIPLTHPKPHHAAALAAAHEVSLIGEVELLHQAQPEATYVGITGTNGKSTTTALIAHVLSQAGRKVQVGGNLGVPSVALEPLDEDGIYVIEMSSYQLDLCQTVRFLVACWLNISPDHIERHGSIEGYVAAKQRIFANQQAGDLAVLGVDDAYSAAVADALAAEGKAVERIAAESIALDLSAAPSLQGTHNAQNAAVAYAACAKLGLSDAEIIAGMCSFGGLAHRMEILGTRGNVTFVNDSKATNADSAAKALATFDNIYWIAGGMAKEGGIEPLTDYFPKVKKAYLIGQDADVFAQTLKAEHVDHTLCGTLEKAAQQAKADAMAAKEDAVLLLSPAAASWDQFTSFEHRGEVFCGLVVIKS